PERLSKEFHNGFGNGFGKDLFSERPGGLWVDRGTAADWSRQGSPGRCAMADHLAGFDRGLAADWSQHRSPGRGAMADHLAGFDRGLAADWSQHRSLGWGAMARPPCRV